MCCCLLIIIISLVFLYLHKVLFSGFLQFNSNFVDGQNDSKYRDGAPLNKYKNYCILLHCNNFHSLLLMAAIFCI